MGCGPFVNGAQHHHEVKFFELSRRGLQLRDEPLQAFSDPVAFCETRAYGPNALTRLTRVAGKQTTTLTHYGRKTGKPHEVPIWFVLDGGKLYIGTANMNRQWVRNVQKTPQVNLSMGGESFSGTARFLTDRTEHERAMAAIRRKYWMFRPIIELGRRLAAIGLMRDNTGSFEVTLTA